MKARLLAVAVLIAAATAYAAAAGPKASPKKAPPPPRAASANSCTACVERAPILPAKLFADLKKRTCSRCAYYAFSRGEVHTKAELLERIEAVRRAYGRVPEAGILEIGGDPHHLVRVRPRTTQHDRDGLHAVHAGHGEPERPAARCISFMIAAISTCFSPAGPMHATLASSSVSARRASVVSGTHLPQRCEASRNSM